MSNPTNPFSWQMPTPTDLVTDLPADFEVFGQAVATSLADLLGGTSGQILAKNSNTDMDFVWIANDQGDITAVTAGTGISGGGTTGAVTITNSMATEITAKADLIVGTGNATFDNLPVGANGTVLTADSTVSPTGLKWATPATGGGMTLINTGGTALSGSTTTVSSIPGTYNSLVIYITDFYQTSAEPFRLYLNGDTTEANYSFAGTRLYGANLNQSMGSNASARVINLDVAASDQNNNLVIEIPNYANTTAFKAYTAHSALYDGSTSTPAITFTAHRWANTSAITEIGFNAVIGNFSGGTMFIYGVK